VEHGHSVARLPAGQLVEGVEPTLDAKYVAFTSLLDPQQFPGQGNSFYPWPYREGLRLDEAMNDLTLMVTGLYGAPLPPQDGAPLRLVTPWKYGFKVSRPSLRSSSCGSARDLLEGNRLK